MADKQEHPEYPGIELEYVLRGESRDWSSAFSLAAKLYAESLNDNESFTSLTEYRKESITIKLGRKVVTQMSYAEIDHVADDMRAEIEGNLALYGNAEALANTFIGRQLLEPLPEQE